MCRGFFDHGLAFGEGRASEDISASDDDGELDAAFGDAGGLGGDSGGFVDGNSAIAWPAEAFAGEFEEDAFEGVVCGICAHVV
jgi:hypothetical protein